MCKFGSSWEGTTHEKQDIRVIHEILQQGKSSTEISLVLGIPSNTIRTHIRRHTELYGGKPCRNCGQIMVQPISMNVKIRNILSGQST